LKLSIITATLNNEKSINKTLDSIISQSYKNFEVIFIDGLSTDNTQKIIKNSKIKNKILINQKKRGVYNAFNLGIKKATGDVIIILNADDNFKHKDTLLEIKNFFLYNKNIDLLMSNVEIVNEKKYIIRNYNCNNFSNYMFYFGHMPPHPGIFIRKRLYIKYGLFEEDFENAGDYEFLLRMLLIKKVRFKKLKKCFIQMSYGGKSNKNFKSYITNTKEIKKALKKNNIRTSYILIIVRFFIKIFQFTNIYSARQK
jgi:glycosyltransferase involved in cell wall biosynthesis|tara:strand:- start:2187 stop:2951 length:765 start_codon:yes stop_codon:yes gene_type:complete